MRKWFFTAAVLIVSGVILFAAIMMINGWDFAALNTMNYVTNTHQIGSSFSTLSIASDTADIEFVKSEDGVCKVVCYEPEKCKHRVTVENDLLTINMVDERKWYEYIGITVGNPKITVYLPENEYTSLHIKESTGDISIPKDFSFKTMHISVSTGHVKNFASAKEINIKATTGNIYVENVFLNSLTVSLSTGRLNIANVTCEGSATISTTTGDITLKNFLVENKLSVEASTGDVELSASDAREIFIKTSTGDVTGSLLSDKVFIVQTDTGDLNVPKTTNGGKCEIYTSTGDIEITVH